MNEAAIRDTILRVLGNIAPEADLNQLQPKVRLRDQLDIDSMDFLNFMIGLHTELHIEIPERDYGRMSTLDGCVDYLTHALQQSK